MFGNFSAYGVVREIQQETTQSGLSGTSVLIKVGEWQGQQGGGEDFVRVTLWRDKAEMAAGLAAARPLPPPAPEPEPEPRPSPALVAGPAEAAPPRLPASAR